MLAIVGSGLAGFHRMGIIMHLFYSVYMGISAWRTLQLDLHVATLLYKEYVYQSNYMQRSLYVTA